MATPGILVVGGGNAAAGERKRRLRGLGYAVTGVVQSGTDAFASATDTPPDIVLLDIQVSGKIDAVETAVRLRAMSHPGIVFLGPGADQQAVECARRANADGFLSTPPRDADLIAAIELALSRRERECGNLELEERFRTLYEESPLAYQSLASDGRIIAVNTAWLKLAGRSREEPIGKPFCDFVTPQSAVEVCRQLPLLYSAGEIHLPRIEMLRSDGGTVLVSLQGKVGRDGRGQFTQAHCLVSDITEATRTRKRLEQSQALLQAIVESLPFDFWACDAEGRYSIQNAASLALWGDQIGKRPEDLGIRREVLAQWEECRRKALAGEVAQGEFRHSIAGTPRTFLSITAPIRDDGGTIGLLGVNIDTTVAHRAAEALRENEERFRLMFEHHEAVMLLIDAASGRIVDANRAAIRFYGYEWDILCAMKVQEVNVLPREELDDAFKRAANGKQSTFVFPHRLASGEVRTVEVHSSPFQLKGREVLFSIIHDITERRLAEDRLKEVNTFLASMMESSSSISIVSNDLEGTIEYWNIGAARMFGYTADEMVGRQPVNILYPRDDEITMNAVADIRTSVIERKQSIRRDVRQVTKSGKMLWVQLTVSPRLNAEGDVVGLLGIGEDITEQKSMEETLVRQASLYETILRAQSDIGEGFVLVEGGRILYANDAFAGISGYTAEELLALPSAAALLPPGQWEAMNRRVEPGPGEREEIHFESVMTRKDGREVDIEGALRPLGDGPPDRVIGIVRNINDRKQAERELRLLGQTVASTKDCFSITDLNDQILFVNEAFCRTYGYAEDELIGRTIAMVLAPGVSPDIIREIRPATLAGGWNGEILNARKDGTVFPIELWTSLVKNDKGDPVALVGVARDITERKRVEERIANSERKFRTVFEHANDAILLLDGALISDCNPRAEQMFMMPRSALLGRSLGSLFPPGRDPLPAAAVPSLLARVHQGLNESFEGRLHRGDETSFDAETNLNPIALDGHSMVQAVIRDITERKRNERIVRESELRLRRITENMLDMITQVDLNGVIQYVSPSVKSILGYDPHVIRGTRAVDLVHPDDAARVTVHSLTALHSASVRRLEYRCRHRLGNYLWIESSINPMVEENGTVSGYTIGSRDITHRKRAEELTKLDESRLETLLKLNEMAGASVGEITEYAIREGVRLTKSNAGFLSFVNEEEATLTLQASSGAVEDEALCSGAPVPLAQGGPSAEPVRRRSPIIANGAPDCPESRCSPAGPVRRLGVPIFDGHTIVALVSVSGKGDDYDQADVRQLTLLIEGMWLILQRRKAEEQIRMSLKEKEVLLKEIHHRVKNNLQIISSLLNLQSDRVKEPRALDIFRDSQNRIRSMALVHERLYRSRDLAAIDFSQYIQSLAAFLFRSYGGNERKVKLDLDIEEVLLAVDVAIPCGLIINELVSNSLKHAFPGTAVGTIGVSLRRNGDMCTLIVKDDGVGFPAAVNIRESESLGLQLVHTLATQIGATMEVENLKGAKFALQFPSGGER